MSTFVDFNADMVHFGPHKKKGLGERDSTGCQWGAQGGAAAKAHKGTKEDGPHCGSQGAHPGQWLAAVMWGGPGWARVGGIRSSHAGALPSWPSVFKLLRFLFLRDFLQPGFSLKRRDFLQICDKFMY